MELRDAFDQISTIRTQLAATERLRGLRAVPVAFSGALALLAAIAQSIWIDDPIATPHAYLLLWLSAAVISALCAGVEVTWRVKHSGSRLSVANAIVAAQQFLPCLMAGAVITIFVAVKLPDLLWMLPGLWLLLFALGNMAAYRLLPRPAIFVGLLYFCAGTMCLWLGERALDPWAMGLPFATGQLTLASLLWWNHERGPRPQEARQ